MNCMIKKILILLYPFCIAAALFAQQPQGEYIKAVRHYYKSDKFSSKMEVLILFDDEGYITYYERKTVEPFIKKDTIIIEGKWEGNNYITTVKESWGTEDKKYSYPPSYLQQEVSKWIWSTKEGSTVDINFSSLPPQIKRGDDENDAIKIYPDIYIFSLNDIYDDLYYVEEGKIKQRITSLPGSTEYNYSYKNNRWYVEYAVENDSAKWEIETNHKFRSWKVNASSYTFLVNGQGFILWPFILGLPFPVPEYSATSYLTEGKTAYKPSNLSSAEGLPWASANGYGIGDVIRVTTGGVAPQALFLVNGYVSKSRPDLYAKNSRLKTVRVTNKANGKRQEVTVADTNEMQAFDISALTSGIEGKTELEFEILEVYPGTHYKDLCIQMLYPQP